MKGVRGSERDGEMLMKSNTNQFISINLSSTCIAVLLFGLDVLCVFALAYAASLSSSRFTFIINFESLSGIF